MSTNMIFFFKEKKIYNVLKRKTYLEVVVKGESAILGV